MENFLYLEDDEDDMFLFDRALNDINGSCNILYASTCFDVMELLRQHSPDIIFLDINVPVVNGIECLTQIRMEPKYEHIPIVMYSTDAHDKWVIESNLQRADMYIKKPKQFEKLKDTLRQLLTLDFRRDGTPGTFRVMI